MLKKTLKGIIPSQLSAFPKLTGGNDPYYFDYWENESNIAILRYWFWNRTKTKQNRKRVFINEFEKLLKQLFISRIVTRQDFEKYCPQTLSDGSCGFAVIIGILQHFQVVEVVDEGYKVKSTERIRQLLDN
jgi:hypothetical protein